MRVVYFDFFGVLSTTAFLKCIEEYIPQARRAEWIKRVDSLDRGDVTEADFVRLMSKEEGIGEKAITNFIEKAPVLNGELMHFLQQLKDKYSIGLLTNAPRSIVERVLKDKISLFDILIISSDVHILKPNQKIFELAVAKAKCDPKDIIFIDDNPENIAAAKNCGINGIVFKDIESLIKEFSAVCMDPTAECPI